MEGSPETYEKLRAEYLKLAERLSKRDEPFPFSPLTEEAYTEIKVSEDTKHTPEVENIDAYIERLRADGMRVCVVEEVVLIEVFSDPEHTHESIEPRKFKPEAIDDRLLRELVVMAQTLHRLQPGN